jgi:hypothetical protein
MGVNKYEGRGMCVSNHSSGVGEGRGLGGLGPMWFVFDVGSSGGAESSTLLYIYKNTPTSRCDSLVVAEAVVVVCLRKQMGGEKLALQRLFVVAKEGWVLVVVENGRCVDSALKLRVNMISNKRTIGLERERKCQKSLVAFGHDTLQSAILPFFRLIA